MNIPKDREHARLIRKIIVAKILSLPLNKYVGLIKKIERDSIFQGLIRKRPRIIARKKLPGTSYRFTSDISGCIASVENHSLQPRIIFHQEGLDREYMIDIEKVNGWIDKSRLTESELKHITYITNKLELISTRNKIFYQTLRGIIHLQDNFFKSGKLLDLRILSQNQLSAWINKHGNHSPIIDESRISRAISTLSININTSNKILVKKLLPTKRALLKHFVSNLIIAEWKDLEFGQLKELYTDEEIASKFHLSSVSRRTIAHCRKEMGIPSRHKRAKNCGYRHVTQSYSPPHDFLRSAVKKSPTCSGVYELSTRDLDIEYEKSQSRVFYIGSGKNIRSRLREHMRPGTPNGAIQKYAAENNCTFRYKLISNDWKLEEKKLYRIFKETYGAPPKANKISP